MASAAVEVRTIDGNAVRGTLRQLDETQVAISTDGGEEAAIAIESVLSISQTDAQETNEANVEIALTCGSKLPVAEVTCTADEVTVSGQVKETQSFPLHRLHSIRFDRHSALTTQWNEIHATKLTGDAVVIRRGDDTLDYLEGVVRSVTPQHVVFNYDGDSIEVPRAKLEGVIFFRKDAQPESGIKLTVTGGCTMHVDQLALRDDAIVAETISGISWTVPVNRLQRIDFAAGKVQYLADLEPHQIEVRASGPSSVQSEALRQLLYEPRANVSLSGEPLALRMSEETGIKEFTRGLAMHSRTEITYRLDSEYRLLRGLVGLDPRSATGGLVKLEIFNGRQRIFSQEISAADDPIELKLDVTGAKRLKLLVDYADSWDLSDHLNLCNLRLTK